MWYVSRRNSRRSNWICMCLFYFFGDPAPFLPSIHSYHGIKTALVFFQILFELFVQNRSGERLEPLTIGHQTADVWDQCESITVTFVTQTLP